ncbi:MAG: hypothetical protein RL169_1366 [Armatimonadota bacterium]
MELLAPAESTDASDPTLLRGRRQDSGALHNTIGDVNNDLPLIVDSHQCRNLPSGCRHRIEEGCERRRDVVVPNDILTRTDFPCFWNSVSRCTDNRAGIVDAESDTIVVAKQYWKLGKCIAVCSTMLCQCVTTIRIRSRDCGSYAARKRLSAAIPAYSKVASLLCHASVKQMYLTNAVL